MQRFVIRQEPVKRITVSRTPAQPIGSVTFTENGTYDVKRKAQAIVNIPLPVYQEKTATENGAVTPDVGYDALSKVNVNIPPPSGSLAITANGSYDVTEKANAFVNVPLPSGSITLTENGTYDVTMKEEAVVAVPDPVYQSKEITENGTYYADEGYDAIEEVIVDIPDPSYQAKTVTTNGVVTADEGYDALEQVTVSVPLPSGSITITSNGVYDVEMKSEAVVSIPSPVYQSKTVTENGTVTPDPGYDALNSVVVNVQHGKPLEISTSAGMADVLIGANIGKAYLYVGTTGTYINGDIYVVDGSGTYYFRHYMEEGSNIVGIGKVGSMKIA